MHELRERIISDAAKHIKRTEQLNANNAQKLMEVKRLREKEKDVYEKQLEISERLQKKYHEEH